MFLLEAPGPKAIQSGFVSRDNPDPTARNLWHLMRDAGLPRSETILWNIVPWYVGEEGRIRATTPADIHEAAAWLPQLLALLPQLR